MRAHEVISEANRLLKRSEEVNALRYGDFTLTSGAKSTFYFDGRLLSTDPESVHIISTVMLNLLSTHNIQVFGGPAVGAVPIIGSVMFAAHVASIPMRGFFVRSEPKAHGMGKQIEGNLLTGDKAAIYDDTISTGGSILTTIDAIRSSDADVAYVMCVLDRQEQGTCLINEQGISTFNMLKMSSDKKVVVDEQAISQWFD